MSKKNNIFHMDSKSYKPFHYPVAYDRYKEHEVALHWTTEEVDLSGDMKDWTTISEAQKHIITSIFQGFTQNDVEVGMGYDLLCRVVKPNEIKMMLRSFNNRESLHQDAYSLLLDTLGFPEEFYTEFEFIPSLSFKYDYIHNTKVKQFHHYVTEYGIENADIEFRKDVAKMIAVYSGTVEGISLFAQFAILASFSRNGKFPGMNKIIEWSVRDEDKHIEGNAWLFKTIIKENKVIWNDDFKRDIYEAFRQMVQKEDEYLDYVFQNYDLINLTKDEMKNYVRYIADQRLKQFGLKPNYEIKENPLPWMDEMLSNITFSNFFDTAVSEYSFGTMKGDWEATKTKMKELFN